jgi:peptide/nickel transport system substrate-binding protein
MEYAIDKQTIVDQILKGLTTPTHTVVSSTVKAYAGDFNTAEEGYTGDFPITLRKYDPDMANQLLNEAGWTLNADGVREKDGQTLEFEWLHYDTGIQMAQAIDSYFTDVGIITEPIPIDSTTFYQTFEQGKTGLMTPESGGPFPMSMNTMGAGPDPDNCKTWIEPRPGEWPWTRGSMNFGFYQNERVGDLIDIGAENTDYATRKAAYDELQQIVHEDAPIVFLWNHFKIQAWNNDFQGFDSNKPVSWWGAYFRGDDDSANINKGVYWTMGTDDPFPKTTVMDTVTQATTMMTTVVFEFMDLRVMMVFAMVMLFGVMIARRRRRED